MKGLDWKNVGAPKGLRLAQRTKAGASWMFGNHQGDFDRFFETGLERAFERVGARMPEMQMTVFEVHTISLTRVEQSRRVPFNLWRAPRQVRGRLCQVHGVSTQALSQKKAARRRLSTAARHSGSCSCSSASFRRKSDAWLALLAAVKMARLSSFRSASQLSMYEAWRSSPFTRR